MGYRDGHRAKTAILAYAALILAIAATDVARGDSAEKRNSFTVSWACPVSPRSPNDATKIPERQTFTFVYTTEPQQPDLTEAKRLLADAAASRDISYASCADEFYTDCLMKSFDLCKKQAFAGGSSPEAAEKHCMSDKPGDLHGELKVALDAIEKNDKNSAHRPAFMPLAKLPVPPVMHPAERERIIDETKKGLASSCELNPRVDSGSVPGMVDAVAFSEEFVEGALSQEVLPKASESCREKIVGSYLDALAEMQPAPALCASAQGADACKRLREATARIVLKLRAAIPDGPLRKTLLYSDSVQSCLTDSRDPAAFLRSLILETSFASSCVALGNGESSVIADMDYSQAGVPANYKLSRKGNQYLAQVNIDFKPAALAAKMRKTASACLRDASTLMKGPNGQSLAVALYDPKAPGNATDPNPPPPSEVSVASGSEAEGFRENSSNWTETTDCETITHETLHLLGLVDEYRETESGYTMDERTGNFTQHVEKGALLPDDNCRILGPPDSIMSDQSAAFRSVKSGKRTSLLYGAQFSALTQPGCIAKNRTYMECARSAYTSTTGPAGGECPGGQPAACQQPAEWLKGPPTP